MHSQAQVDVDQLLLAGQVVGREIHSQEQVDDDQLLSDEQVEGRPHPQVHDSVDHIRPDGQPLAGGEFIHTIEQEDSDHILLAGSVEGGDPIHSQPQVEVDQVLPEAQVTGVFPHLQEQVAASKTCGLLHVIGQ